MVVHKVQERGKNTTQVIFYIIHNNILHMYVFV